MKARMLTCVLPVWLAFAVGVGMLGGCGSGHPPTYRAGGKVTFADGRPLPGGWVEFQPVDSQHRVSARGEIQPDGTFELGTFGPRAGAIEGEHRALVTPPPLQGDRDDMKSVPLVIDPRFQRFETSGLKYTVTRSASENRFQIQVTPPR